MSLSDGDLRVIVAGGGLVGLRTTELLADRGHNVVLIEENPERVEDLVDEYVATIIEGNAARPSVLRQSQPDRSDVIAALTDDEAANLAICETAQRMAEIRTVMRVESDPDELYPEIVDGTVFPASLGARAAVNEIVGTGVRTLEDVGADLEIVEVEVAPDAPVAGKSLANISLPRGSLIVADAHGGEIGGPDTVLEPGERYILAVQSDVAEEVMNLLRG